MERQSHSQEYLPYSTEALLQCVEKTCDTIQESQLEILSFLKSNLERLKVRVQHCIIKVENRELTLKTRKSTPRETVETVNCLDVVIHGLSEEVVKTGKEKESIEGFFLQAIGVSVDIKKVQTFNSKNNKLVVIVTVAGKHDKKQIFRNCHRLKDYPLKVSITDNKYKSSLKCTSNELIGGGHAFERKAVNPVPNKVREELCEEIVNGNLSTSAPGVNEIHDVTSKGVSNEPESSPLCHLSPDGQQSSLDDIDWERLEEKLSEILENHGKDKVERISSVMKSSNDKNSYKPTALEVNDISKEFMQEKPVKKKIKQLRSYGIRRFDYDEGAIQYFWNVHGQLLKPVFTKEGCICKKILIFPVVEWNKIEPDYPFFADYIKKQEDVLQLMSRIWIEKYAERHKFCFCHFLMQA